jgi:hypothetical protein
MGRRFNMVITIPRVTDLNISIITIMTRRHVILRADLGVQIFMDDGREMDNPGAGLAAGVAPADWAILCPIL